MVIDASLKDFETTDQAVFNVWADRVDELGSVAQPILETLAFKRLAAISFLGILSPSYAQVSRSPIYRRKSIRCAKNISADGSRQSHSLGVALIALDLCRYLGYSPEVQKYAIAWGLLHDVGNWPLSHTGEYAFSRVSGASTKEIRLWLINADRRISSQYWVRDALLECGINPARLGSLFLHQPDRDLETLSNILRSPLTPDMLEGMWRAGLAFGVDVPSPSQLREVLWKNLFDRPFTPSSASPAVIRFWRAKSEIYRRFFNSRTVARWESSWSVSILHAFKNISLEESFQLSERSIIERVSELGIPITSDLHRWKHPQRYALRSDNTKILPNIEIEDLPSILIEEPMDESIFS